MAGNSGVEGYTVFTSTGAEVGKIVEAGQGFLHVETGLLGLGHDLYVPYSCIDHCDSAGQCCTLLLDEWDLGQMKWTIPPEAGASTTCQPTRGVPGEIPEVRVPRSFVVREPDVNDQSAE